MDPAEVPPIDPRHARAATLAVRGPLAPPKPLRKTPPMSLIECRIHAFDLYRPR